MLFYMLVNKVISKIQPSFKNLILIKIIFMCIYIYIMDCVWITLFFNEKSC